MKPQNKMVTPAEGHQAGGGLAQLQPHHPRPRNPPPPPPRQPHEVPGETGGLDGQLSLLCDQGKPRAKK